MAGLHRRVSDIKALFEEFGAIVLEQKLSKGSHLAFQAKAPDGRIKWFFMSFSASDHRTRQNQRCHIRRWINGLDE